MSRWHVKIADAISPYRIKDDVLYRYLSIKECKYGARIAADGNTPELEKLLSILRDNSIEENDGWLSSHVEIDHDRPGGNHTLIFVREPINSIRDLNGYLIGQNELLADGGVLVIWFHSSLAIKLRIFRRYPRGISHLIYFLHFFWYRVCPKLLVVRKIYFLVTKGKHQVYPRSEVLGRLYYCGFEVRSEKYVNDRYYVVARKIKVSSPDAHPLYGPLFYLKRVGKGGKLIKVYKLRTMHAYSEYLQEYVYEHNDLQEGGKFANDYRISSWGKVLRKVWLDELPMILNIVKGQMKLVGVRPLSQQYFSLYTPEMQALRIKVKPGLLPPFYYDRQTPRTIEEVQASEKRYIEEYLASPFRTDWKYFWGTVGNILFHNKRSK